MFRLFLASIYYVFISFGLWLRYRIKQVGVKELKKATTFDKSKGILFLANHPAEIDPLILLKLFWFRFHLRPVAIEYLFQMPIVRYFLDFVGSLSIPNFDTSSNSYKRKRIEEIYEKIFSLLEEGQSILIYPAGGLKQEASELIAGASGVHTILQKMPDITIVMIRTTGLWGSSFSRAQTGRSPNVVEAFLHGIRVLLKNGIFFAPRRKVLVECQLAPKDFPRSASRLEVNRYLENWYNERGPEPLSLVSYSFWKEELPAVYTPKKESAFSLASVPNEVQEKVYEELITITGKPKEELAPDLDLRSDLGLDSLDIAQVSVLLKEQFGALSVNSVDLRTIGDVMLFAAKVKESKEEEIEEKPNSVHWKEEKERPPVKPPTSSTLLEAFLQTAGRMEDAIACVDALSGQVSYKQFKRAVIALAIKIRKLPGDNVGIMLPASVAVNVIILATLLAGKLPVMINWTLGKRNLESVVAQGNIKATLSSWNFLDRLENVELDGIDDTFVLLEDVKRSMTLFDKVKAFRYWRLSDQKLLRRFGVDNLSAEDRAVILFTSGTESVPKGVPLSHGNILANLRGALSYVDVTDQDVLLGMLPPFHSFGFSVTGLMPLISGMRCVFSPNPTDARRIASLIEKWGVTLCCSAPTFLKTIFRVSKKEQVESLRLVVAGAEKTPQELFTRLAELNETAVLVEGYGITECSPILTINPPSKPTAGVGLPLPATELMVVHPETHEPLDRGEVGLILAHGPSVFGGYLDKSLRSPFISIQEKLWYETGDLGFLDERGYLTLSGRLKRFVKIGGEMVSLGAIEETLLEAGQKESWPLDPELPSLAVCASEEAGEKAKIHLFTTFSLEKAQANEVLKKGGMSNLIKVSSVTQLPCLPLLGTGKINYRALMEKIT